MNKLIAYILLLLLFTPFGCTVKEEKPEPIMREIVIFDFDWRFKQGDKKNWSNPNFNDSAWQGVQTPHDWSIEGPFDQNNPSRDRGAYLPTGIAWYRKTFNLPEEDMERRIFILFDGIYRNSEVWINGKHLGNRPDGYISFFYEITKHLHYGKEKNVIAVRVDNQNQPASRWYTGSGIYRHVRLVKTGHIHIPIWGVYLTTQKITQNTAEIHLKTDIENYESKDYTVHLETSIIDARGNKIDESSKKIKLNANSTNHAEQVITLRNPQLWSPDHPNIYHAETQIILDERTMDTYSTSFGLRTFRFDPDKGFFLNGKNLKIKGVCLHHDCGCLGAACPDEAIERKISKLKDMGCNAIRTSHNPPAPRLLDICDRYGMLVMAEAFDEWKHSKYVHDVHKKEKKEKIKIQGNATYFEEWGEKDLRDFIRRDRNHPCIIMWSIGNEVVEQTHPEGGTIARKLVDIVHKLDPTRPVTAGLNKIRHAEKNGITDALDIVGYNYYGNPELGAKQYDIDHEKYPKRIIIGSETASAFGTRGVYYMPADSLVRKSKEKYTSAYDNAYANWGDSHRNSWKSTIERPFVAGEFIWTGFDYLGEPTPYEWPARSAYFGIIDLAGFPKDAYYFYQSQWTDSTVLHLLPHWNWEGKEGQPIDIWCYTNCQSVELFVNNQSQGEKFTADAPLFNLSWQVPYQPGTLKAIGKNNNQAVKEVVIHTAAKPDSIILKPDRTVVRSSGEKYK